LISSYGNLAYLVKCGWGRGGFQFVHRGKFGRSMP